MAIYKDAITGKMYDTDVGGLEGAQAEKLKYLQKKGQTPTLGGVDISSSPTPAPIPIPNPSASPSLSPMNPDPSKTQQVQQGFIDSTGLYNGGKVKDPKKDALRKMRGY